MQALLLKDLYTLKGQMKVFLFILIILALAFQAEAGVCAVFYATLLPVTSLAYDEQSKWPQLALMLPYSIKDLVVSKYLLGWLLAVAVALWFGFAPDGWWRLLCGSAAYEFGFVLFGLNHAYGFLAGHRKGTFAFDCRVGRYFWNDWGNGLHQRFVWYA